MVGQVPWPEAGGAGCTAGESPWLEQGQLPVQELLLQQAVQEPLQPVEVLLQQALGPAAQARERV